MTSLLTSLCLRLKQVADFVREVRRVLSGVRRRKSQTVQLEKRLQRIGKVNKRTYGTDIILL